MAVFLFVISVLVQKTHKNVTCPQQEKGSVVAYNMLSKVACVSKEHIFVAYNRAKISTIYQLGFNI